MKYFFLSYIFVAAIIVSAAGLRGTKSLQPPIEILPDMDNQTKVKAQARSDFFADGAGGRPPVHGTIPMGYEIPAKPATEKPAPPAFGFSHGSDYYSTGSLAIITARGSLRK
jgi:hypothetical protein